MNNHQIIEVRHMLITAYTLVVLATLMVSVISSTANAETMSSTNYKVESDSVNFGGGRATSASYKIEDTMGEIATGISSSTNYTLKAGYQQNNVVTLSVTPATNVIMSPEIGGLTGGTSNGETSFSVTTDNPAGYTATISAEGSPALNSPLDSFSDYVPVGAVPDFSFSNNPSSSSFAFSPEGDDIDIRYKNSGITCGVGSNDDANACWDGLSTSEKTILNRPSANQPIGTITTLKFRAESGNSHVQLDGVYVATTTVTVLSL
jgi:hypothetical protein